MHVLVYIQKGMTDAIVRDAWPKGSLSKEKGINQEYHPRKMVAYIDGKIVITLFGSQQTGGSFVGLGVGL